MIIKYLDAARQGRNEWWRYILGLLVPWATIIIASMGLFISFLILGIIHLSDFNPPATAASWMKKIPLWAIYITTISLVSLMCTSILVWMEKAHHRNPFSVICPDPNQSFNLKRCLNAFAVWLTLSLPFSVGLFYTYRYIYEPQSIKLIADPTSWLIYLIPMIALILITTLFLEITRGYILQGLGLIVKNKSLLIVISGLMLVCIAALSNQKNSQYIQIQSAIGAFIFGSGLTMFILKENGLELVLGIEAASSLLSKFIAYQSSEDSLFPPAIISIDKNTQIYSSSVAIGLVISFIKLAIFYAIFFRKSSPVTQE
jgi:uncharacterized protein